MDLIFQFCGLNGLYLILAIDDIKLQADAIIDAMYPGEAFGALAVADLIFGKFRSNYPIFMVFIVLEHAWLEISKQRTLSTQRVK